MSHHCFTMLSPKRCLDLLLANGRLIPPVFQRLWSLEQSLCKCSLQDPTKSCHSPVAHSTEPRVFVSTNQTDLKIAMYLMSSTNSSNCIDPLPSASTSATICCSYKLILESEQNTCKIWNKKITFSSVSVTSSPSCTHHQQLVAPGSHLRATNLQTHLIHQRP